ncbi:MAG: TIGR02186 family protein [Hyphomonadaceae bacterium]|nr:TIGR02186 family protein [Hyphomonadaceae bacterium]
MRLAAFLCAALAAPTLALAQQTTPESAPVEPPTILEVPQADAPVIRSAPRAPRRPRPRAEEASPAANLPAAVTEEDIAVTSDYRGFNVTVFGVNPDRLGRGDIVVALRGPKQTVSVRRKMRFLGLWVNGPPVRFTEAPSFLAVVSARPLRDVANNQAIWALGLDAAAAPRLDGPTPPGADPSDYRRAFSRLRRQSGLFVENPRGLQKLESGLFVTHVRIPAYAPIGQYAADVYLFRGGRLISSRSNRVLVSRQGVERTIHDFAVRLPLVYGLATVLLAIAAGWSASVLLRRR